jgi:multiple sugar transport system substrate-binding protein
LYLRLPEIASRLGVRIEVGLQAPHPELNEAIERAGRSGPLPFDLISTHIKYAPSQAEWLRPLDDLLSNDDLSAFAPGLLAHCRFQGRLLQLPRLFDARLMHYRKDRFGNIPFPRTWHELAETASAFTGNSRFGFAFPGRSSGLFGTFFELLVMNGGTLLDDELRPAFASEIGVETLAHLNNLYAVRQVTPRELPEWHFDEVSESFRNGSVAMVGDWPGYFGLHRGAVAGDSLGIARYPTGSTGIRKVYSGSHSFAITSSCLDVPAAIAVLREMTSFESQVSEARRGVFPARVDALDAIREEVRDDALALRRIDLLDATIREGDALTFPQLAAYPDIEEAVWPMLRSGFTGAQPVRQCLTDAAAKVSAILGGHQ